MAFTQVSLIEAPGSAKVGQTVHFKITVDNIAGFDLVALPYFVPSVGTSFPIGGGETILIGGSFVYETDWVIPPTSASRITVNIKIYVWDGTMWASDAVSSHTISVEAVIPSNWYRTGNVITLAVARTSPSVANWYRTGNVITLAVARTQPTVSNWYRTGNVITLAVARTQPTVSNWYRTGNVVTLNVKRSVVPPPPPAGVNIVPLVVGAGVVLGAVILASQPKARAKIVSTGRSVYSKVKEVYKK